MLCLFSHHISLQPANCITIHRLNQQINFYSLDNVIEEFSRIHGGHQPNPLCLASCQTMCQLGYHH